MTVPGYPFLNNCQSLQSLLDSESNDCVWIQSIGSICGCAVLGEDPCLLCTNKNNISLQYPTQLAHVDISELLAGTTDIAGGQDTTALPALALIVLEQPTCELVQAYLQSRSATESQCLEIQTLVADTCTCGAGDNNNNDTDTNTTTTIPPIDQNDNLSTITNRPTTSRSVSTLSELGGFHCLSRHGYYEVCERPVLGRITRPTNKRLGVTRPW